MTRSDCYIGGSGHVFRRKRVEQGIAYLRGKTGICTNPPHHCERVSCSWSAGI
ncbi:hypothetical protein B0T26DRAFT_536251 [Lasiosphaeria miniovina]|uniref:Uncharacterized protein n=1 Tax=Lasiosphaeria miniovina TaxID=1954250 RepID=A0AA39ZQR0_9PEZI|nr:uncharacterized protein B0T26DRAFT_536251 [Lasiosphaeria miniovina]KAK0701912.1 hypothetical protein B0T26DRAFT_536251 [Lasiosphaeria miniovina]